jgi:GNAT superfamily N-acetyltransferase
VSQSNPARFSIVEQTRDGRRLQIRALQPGDKAEMLAAVGRISAQSLYKRFFGVKRHFSDKEVDFFLNVDFKSHVALVAVVEENGTPTIAGGGRFVVVRPEKAEVAFAVVDDYQGQSIGTALLRHLASLAREAGLSQLIAEVLPTNTPMLKVFEKSGMPVSLRHDRGSVHVTIGLSETRSKK